MAAKGKCIATVTEIYSQKCKSSNFRDQIALSCACCMPNQKAVLQSVMNFNCILLLDCNAEWYYHNVIIGGGGEETGGSQPTTSCSTFSNLQYFCAPLLPNSCPFLYYSHLPMSNLMANIVSNVYLLAFSNPSYTEIMPVRNETEQSHINLRVQYSFLIPCFQLR